MCRTRLYGGKTGCTKHTFPQQNPCGKGMISPSARILSTFQCGPSRMGDHTGVKPLHRLQWSLSFKKQCRQFKTNSQLFLFLWRNKSRKTTCTCTKEFSLSHKSCSAKVCVAIDDSGKGTNRTKENVKILPPRQRAKKSPPASRYFFPALAVYYGNGSLPFQPLIRLCQYHCRLKL